MNSLLESEELVDVTLAVEGKFLKAHKMVLSVCSPYFKELFKSNPCQHPIVFMKDVSYVAISDLLQFMYQGEVQVSQDNLTTFIKTAEALQIKGLTGDGNGSTDADSEPVQEKPTRHIEESYKPVPRPKKQLPAPVVTTTPSVKRPRLSASSNDSQSAPMPIAKSEPTSTPISNVDSGAVQFKVEPYDQNQSVTIPDDGDDNFGDDTLDDNTVDDTEDYAMMEGEEPQAGTSTDGTGEGQDIYTSYQQLVTSPSPTTSSNGKPVKVPQVNDYVVVKLVAQRSIKHYIAVIMSITEEDEFVAKFMRKSCGNKFTFPVTDDIANIETYEIAEVLNQPSVNNRQQYTFSVDLSKYKNMS